MRQLPEQHRDLPAVSLPARRRRRRQRRPQRGVQSEAELCPALVAQDGPGLLRARAGRGGGGSEPAAPRCQDPLSHQRVHGAASACIRLCPGERSRSRSRGRCLPLRCRTPVHCHRCARGQVRMSVSLSVCVVRKRLLSVQGGGRSRSRREEARRDPSEPRQAAGPQRLRRAAALPGRRAGAPAGQAADRKRVPRGRPGHRTVRTPACLPVCLPLRSISEDDPSFLLCVSISAGSRRPPSLRPTWRRLPRPPTQRSSSTLNELWNTS